MRRQEEGVAWAQKPVQHHFCHLLLVNAVQDCPPTRFKGVNHTEPPLVCEFCVTDVTQRQAHLPFQ